MQHAINLELSKLTFRQKLALKFWSERNWNMVKACVDDMEETGDCDEANDTEKFIRFFKALRWWASLAA